MGKSASQTPGRTGKTKTVKNDENTRKARVGNFYCRGCDQFFTASAFADNQILERSCKAIYDYLQKMAARQGQQVWFKAQAADPTSLQSMIKLHDQQKP